MSDILVRRYHARDRAAVRAVACDTADRGSPMEHFFHDRELFADLATRYYTDDEPETLWVAEADSRLVGYLTGCRDSRRYWRMLSFRIIPQAVVAGLCRGLLGQPATWRMGMANVRTLGAGGLARIRLPDGYPAHLHLNLREGWRGRAVGPRLLEAFLAQLTDAGVPGVHAAVRADNGAACRFFERMGFHALSRHPVILPRGPSYERHETILYGKRLA